MKRSIKYSIPCNPQLNGRVFIPLLFKGEMVNAVLLAKNPKTQTRRIITPKNSSCTSHLHELDFNDVVYDGKNSPMGYLKVYRPADETRHRIWPKATPSDIFWVRETYCNIPKDVITEGSDFLYRAATHVPYGNWKPNIFMPFEACRIFLEIKKIRPERLNDISDEDALKEGIRPFTKDEKLFKYGIDGWIWQTGKNPLKPSMQKTPKEAYKMLWEHINGPGSWKKNDFVWIYDFNLLVKI